MNKKIIKPITLLLLCAGVFFLGSIISKNFANKSLEVAKKPLIETKEQKEEAEKNQDAEKVVVL